MAGGARAPKGSRNHCDADRCVPPLLFALSGRGSAPLAPARMIAGSPSSIWSESKCSEPDVRDARIGRRVESGRKALGAVGEPIAASISESDLQSVRNRYIGHIVEPSDVVAMQMDRRELPDELLEHPGRARSKSRISQIGQIEPIRSEKRFRTDDIDRASSPTKPRPCASRRAASPRALVLRR